VRISTTYSRAFHSLFTAVIGLLWVCTCHAQTEGHLPGQIILDPGHPDKVVYNRDADQDGRLDPAFLCGPGGPEGFLYGDISGGDTPDTVLDKMIRHGGNCIYIQGIRSHGGDGQAHHNPFVDHDPSKGLDSVVLKKWERWFDRMEAHGIVIYFFLFDDEVKIGPKDSIATVERDYICGIVNAFEHHANLVWVIAEEYSEIFSQEKVSRIAAMVRREDDRDHLIASHQLPSLTFDHADDPVIDQFAMQLRSTEGPCGDIHKKCLKALENANGRYSVNLAEQYDWHSDLLEAGDRDGVRRVNWAAAITGTHIMHLGTWETTRKRRPPSVGMLEDYRRVHAFMESMGDLNLMSPQDHLVKSGTAWVLGRRGHHIVYFSQGGTAKIDLAGDDSLLHVTWYNPRSGKYIPKGTVQSGAVRSFTAPDGRDWVLVLNATSHWAACKELRRSPVR
jgi:hypothetical protein